jgi:hypothetical protein
MAQGVRELAREMALTVRLGILAALRRLPLYCATVTVADALAVPPMPVHVSV